VRTSEFTTKATTPQGDSEDFAARLNVKLWVVVVVVVVTGAAAPSGAAEKKEKPSRKVLITESIESPREISHM
jgi:hypothetical protein